MPINITNYPAQIDTAINLPPAVDNFTPVSGAVFNGLRGAIVAIETALGVQPAGIYSTVAGRFTVLENTIGNLENIQLAQDLGGTPSHPLVIGIQGRPVSSVAPGLGQVIAWNGIAWVPANVTMGSTNTFGGDLSGNNISQTVIGLQGHSLSAIAPTSGQILSFNGSQWVPSGFTLTGPAGGDLAGSYPNPTVAKLQGTITLSGTPTSGQILTATSGTAASWQAAPSSFTAGGDLSGTNISQTVIGLEGKTLPALTTGYLNYTGTTFAYTALPTSLPPNGAAGGDLGGTYPNPTVLSVTHVTTGVLPAANQAAQTMAGAIGGTTAASTLNLTGNVSITGTLPNANQAPQTMGGDVTGTTAANTTIALRGKSLNTALATVGSAQDGYALTWVNADGYWEAKPMVIPSNGWTTVLDLDFTQQTTQSLATDGYYTIGGYTWQKENSAADNTAMAVTNGVGLVINPSSASTRNYIHDRTSPLLRLPLTSFWPAADLGTRIRIYVSLGNTSTDNTSGASGRYFVAGIDSNSTSYIVSLMREDGNGSVSSFTVTTLAGAQTVTSTSSTGQPVGNFDKTPCWQLDSVMPNSIKIVRTSTLTAGIAFPAFSTLIGAQTVSVDNPGYGVAGNAATDLGLTLSCGIQSGDSSFIIHVQRVRVDVLL